MKISHVSIRNYRSIEKLDMPINDYTALVGANGSGKSSVLYAIDWILNGRILSADDVHSVGEAEEGAEATTVSVELTFDELGAADRIRLEKYGRGDSLTVRKSWTVGEPKPKMIGKSLQGPDFVKVRSAVGIANARSEYNTLRTAHSELGEPTRLASMPELESLMSAWEDDPEHQSLLVAVDDDEANSFFGFDGQNRLKQCLRMVLVPAASDIPSEVAGGKKGSAVNDLIGVLMGNAGAEAREAWIVKNEAVIGELTDSMREKIATATGLEADRVNKRLQALISNSSLTFTPEVPVWVPNPTPVVTTDVSIDGITNDVSRQGHGIQRAVMIAMFESLAPDEDSAERDHLAEEGETEVETEARLQTAKSQLPSLLVCIEEPEIYQHPIRARAFARVLSDLAEQPRAQVLLATHSPYFVMPAQFESLRRFTLSGGKSHEAHTTIPDVTASTLGAGNESKVRRRSASSCPQRSLKASLPTLLY
ncbi:MAG: ATP-binding protein [Actinobacteria bacterium]|nr:ATP-binding protein [Actinomycetota bacterium]